MENGLKEEILGYLRQGEDMEAIVREDSRWELLYHFSKLRENLLEWYAFEKDAAVIELGAGCGALSVFLAENVRKVLCCEEAENEFEILEERCRKYENIETYASAYPPEGKKADYIIVYGSFLVRHSLAEVLEQCRRMEQENTVLILAVDNRMGLRCWNGVPEAETGQTFEGLMDYPDEERKYTYSKKEIEKELEVAGKTKLQFYYPMPDYRIPMTIYSDSCLPESGQIRNVTASYDRERLELFREEPVYDTLCQDGMFSYFANSFLVFVGAPKNPFVYIRCNRLRCPQFQTSTRIREEQGRRLVEKKALNEQSAEHLNGFLENYIPLQKKYKNLEVLKAREIPDGIAYDFLEMKTAENLLLETKEFSWEFLRDMRTLVEKIFEVVPDAIVPFEKTPEFEKVFGAYGEVIAGDALCGANVDMALDNIMLGKESMVMFDYEWVFDFPIPEKFPRYRSLAYFYDRNDVFFKGSISRKEYMEYMDISETESALFEQMEQHFQEYARGKGLCYSYLEHYKKAIVPFGEYEQLKQEGLRKDRDIEQLNDLIYSKNEYIQGLEQLIEKYHNTIIYKMMNAVRTLFKR